MVVVLILFVGIFFYSYREGYYKKINFEKIKILEYSKGGIKIYKLKYKGKILFSKEYSVNIGKYKNEVYEKEWSLRNDIEKLKNGTCFLKRTGEIIEVIKKREIDKKIFLKKERDYED